MLDQITYREAWGLIRDGDLLLFRSRDWYTRLIGVGDCSPYVHAAMAGWWDVDHYHMVPNQHSRLMVIEVTNRSPGCRPLSHYVERWPGMIDWYPVRSEFHTFDRAACLSRMVDLTQHPYGWRSLLATSLRHVAVVRFFVRPNTNDGDPSKWPPYCSQAVAIACRAGGVDAVPNKPDRFTEPVDLSESLLYDKSQARTLVWEDAA